VAQASALRDGLAVANSSVAASTYLARLVVEARGLSVNERVTRLRI